MEVRTLPEWREFLTALGERKLCESRIEETLERQAEVADTLQILKTRSTTLELSRKAEVQEIGEQQNKIRIAEKEPKKAFLERARQAVNELRHT